MSVHLGDNDITREYAFLNQILNYFNLGENDLHECHRSEVIKNQTLMNDPKAGYTKAGTIDYKGKINKILGFQNKNEKVEQKVDLKMQRQILKDHLLLGKQQKIVDTFKAINATIMREGVGRMQDS